MMLNMGTTDRTLRAIAGLVLAALPVLDIVGGIWAVVAYAAAAILLATAAVGFCPLYAPFRWSTRPKATPQA